MMLLIGEYLADKHIKVTKRHQMYVGLSLMSSRTTSFYSSLVNCRITIVFIMLIYTLNILIQILLDNNLLKERL